MKRLSPREIYRLEKERAQRERGLSHAELMAEAQRAFDKLLADANAARKSGRPKRAPGAAPEASAKKAKAPAVPKAPTATRPAAKRTTNTAKKTRTAADKTSARSKSSARTAAKGRTASKSKSAAAKKRPAKTARKTGRKR
jgi:DNA-binding protein HU-beta